MCDLDRTARQSDTEVGKLYRSVILDEDILVIIANLVDEYSRIELKPTVPKNVYEKLKVDLRLQVDISGEFWKNQFFINTKNGGNKNVDK